MNKRCLCEYIKAQTDPDFIESISNDEGEALGLCESCGLIWSWDRDSEEWKPEPYSPDRFTRSVPRPRIH